MAQTLTASLAQLLKTWWRQDRIRTSRNCGQLLTLEVGTRLLIGNHIYRVLTRGTDGEEHGNRSRNEPTLADSTTSLGNTDEHDRQTQLFDEPFESGVPTRVEYLLHQIDDEHQDKCGADQHASRWVLSLAADEKILCQVARLTVPLASRDAIVLCEDQQPHELLVEDIVILPCNG